MLGILMRSMQTGCKVGTFNWKSILTAYYGNVRSIVEYCCVIWVGTARTHLDRIERVQHRFLQWLQYDVYAEAVPMSIGYPRLLHSFDVTCSESRRHQDDILFVGKVCKGKIYSSELLNNFPLYAAPRSTRMTERTRGIMAVPFARVDTIKRSLFVRAPIRVNEL